MQWHRIGASRFCERVYQRAQNTPGRLNEIDLDRTNHPIEVPKALGRVGPPPPTQRRYFPAVGGRFATWGASRGMLSIQPAFESGKASAYGM